MNHQPSKRRRVDTFMPLLLSAVSMVLTLSAVIIHCFVYPFGEELLSPMLAEILILLFPACLCLMLLSPERSTTQQMKSIGMAKLSAEYIFFMIYAVLFLFATSLILNFLFGGAYSASVGFTLFGIFTAGVNEYTVSLPYLILVYAIVPAIVEELVFRGVLFREFSEIGTFFAVCLTSVISALFAFSPGTLVATLFCSLAYCFLRHTTGALQSAMLVHFAVNLLNLLLGTNIYRYFSATGNKALLLIILIGFWLLSTALFCNETASIYRVRALEIREKKRKSDLPALDLKGTRQSFRSALSHRPTLICGIITLVCYIAVAVITLVT